MICWNFMTRWYRYIDNLLVVWRGMESELERFMQVFNQNNKNIRLTYSCNMVQIYHFFFLPNN